jgi:hypothetical protein
MHQPRRAARRHGRRPPGNEVPPVHPAAAPRRSPRGRGARAPPPGPPVQGSGQRGQKNNGGTVRLVYRPRVSAILCSTRALQRRGDDAARLPGGGRAVDRTGVTPASNRSHSPARAGTPTGLGRVVGEPRLPCSPARRGCISPGVLRGGTAAAHRETRFPRCTPRQHLGAAGGAAGGAGARGRPPRVRRCRCGGVSRAQRPGKRRPYRSAQLGGCLCCPTYSNAVGIRHREHEVGRRACALTHALNDKASSRLAIKSGTSA